MMAAATAGCGSGGSDDKGSDDECGDFDATSINNKSNDDDNDDAEINPIVMPHQDIEPGGADYLEGGLGNNIECDNTRADSTNGPDEEATSGMYSDWYNTSIMGRYLKALHEIIKLEVGSLSCSTTRLGLADQWLFGYLKPHEYWVEIKDARDICDKLELAFRVPSYYR
jgi:hypothetical protein